MGGEPPVPQDGHAGSQGGQELVSQVLFGSADEARITKCAPVSRIASSPSWEGNPRSPRTAMPGPRAGRSWSARCFSEVELPPSATAISVRDHTSISDTMCALGPLPWGEPKCTEFCEASPPGPRSRSKWVPSSAVARRPCHSPQHQPLPGSVVTGPDSARLALPAAAAAGNRSETGQYKDAGGSPWPPAGSGAGVWRAGRGGPITAASTCAIALAPT